MKLKFPKQIIIGNSTFNIKYDKKSGGGSFKYSDGKNKAEIVIGIKDEHDILNVIIHELSEILHLELVQRFRYWDNNSNYLFSFDHSGFTTHTNMLSGLLKNFIA